MKIKNVIIGAMCFSMGTFAFAGGYDDDGGLPDHPKPGQCFVHKFFPPQYSQEEISVKVKDEYKTYEIIPAVFKDVQIQVQTSDGYDNFQVTPPIFKTTYEKIKIVPEDPVWTVNCCDNRHHKPGQPCEQACYKPVKPEYKVITVQTLVDDGKVITTHVGPTYTTVMYKKLEVPPSVKTTDHPAEYIKVKVSKLESPGYMKWVEGTCSKYTCDPKKLQKALKDVGYYNGKVDGVITEETIVALNKFREDKGLGIHDEMDRETAVALGIEI